MMLIGQNFTHISIPATSEINFLTKEYRIYFENAFLPHVINKTIKLN